VHDGLGRAISTWTGTDDTGWSDTSAPGSNTNMTQVSANQYDGGAFGDSTLTQTTLFPGGGLPNRVTQTLYDFRDRPTYAETGVGGAAGTHQPITNFQYDNLNERTDVTVYDGDGTASLTMQLAATKSPSTGRSITPPTTTCTTART
jgi:hypothetical protein